LEITRYCGEFGCERVILETWTSTFEIGCKRR
jgi:hypothetical protein